MDRDKAVKEFVEAAEFDKVARETFEAVLQQGPRALLFVWEGKKAAGMTAVPFSLALIDGMVALATRLNGDEEEEEE